MRGDGDEKVVPELHDHGQTGQHIHGECETLPVEVVECGSEAREHRVRRTPFILEPPVLIALFVLVDPFCGIGGVALVH